MKEVNYSFERLQVDFDERDHIRNAIAQLKKTHAISGCRVLELGSGAGANLAILQPENEVLGVEGLADAAAHATRLGVNTLVANLDNALPLESAQYDWVLCLDVLEHLLSPDTALREAHRLLKPGGKLLINVPNHFTLTGRLRMLLGAGIHWNRFSPAATIGTTRISVFLPQAQSVNYWRALGFVQSAIYRPSPRPCPCRISCASFIGTD
jgi:SAM-dependent methyltransferase